MGRGIPEVRLLARYLHEDGDWRDGVRPANVIETLDDAEWLVRHTAAMRGYIVCGYCGDEGRFRNLREAASWFLGHECAAEGEVLELSSRQNRDAA